MTFKLQDAQTLTYVAVRLREETRGCGQWDHAGTFAVIRELIGQNYGESLHRIVGHAVDPEARTPGAIRRPFVPKRLDEPGRRQPAKAGEDCKAHPGEHVGSCRACAVQHIDVATDPVLADDDRSAGRALLASIRARREGISTAVVDVQAANAELIDRLRENERERARRRPPPDPDAPMPRLFTSADYDPERVHAAQARAALERSTR